MPSWRQNDLRPCGIAVTVPRPFRKGRARAFDTELLRRFPDLGDSPPADMLRPDARGEMAGEL